MSAPLVMDIAQLPWAKLMSVRVVRDDAEARWRWTVSVDWETRSGTAYSREQAHERVADAFRDLQSKGGK